MLAKQLKSLQVVAEDGNTYSLYSGQNPADLLALDGAGMATVRRITQRTPLQNGVTDRGFRLEPRKMTLALYIYQGSDEQIADTMRDKLAYIFGPTITSLQLRATRLDSTVRQIDCFVDGTLDFPQSERMGASQKLIVPLMAPDPTWYDPTQVSATTSLASLPVTTSVYSAAGVTADDWPVIEITGPITNPVVNHFPVGDSIDFTGTTIPSGETWVIDLRPGYKKVYRKSDNANRMYALTTSSIRYFGTLRMLNQKLAASYSQTGNSFQVTGSASTGASSFKLLYYKRYLSL
jgi:hypothetical protein